MRKKSTLFCCNCGKKGHTFKNCKQPIISNGLLAFHIDNSCMDPALALRLISRACSTQHVLSEFFFHDIEKMSIDKSKIQIRYLMVRRKNSLGFMEFMRGKYNPHKFNTLKNIAILMTRQELDLIKNNSFDKLWTFLWKHKVKYHNNKHDKNMSKSKYDCITANGFLEKMCTTVEPLYKYPEWGFPKGRRNSNESDMMCGIREFIEETGYHDAEIQVLDKLSRIEEVFRGTNNIPYKHVYFPSYCMFAERNIVSKQNHEIGEIGWFTLDEALGLIRNRHHVRKNIIINLDKQIRSWIENNKITLTNDSGKEVINSVQEIAAV